MTHGRKKLILEEKINQKMEIGDRKLKTKMERHRKQTRTTNKEIY